MFSADWRKRNARLCVYISDHPATYKGAQMQSFSGIKNAILLHLQSC